MSPLLSTRDLSFSYAAKTILHGLSFDVRQGETVAIVGANGVGKTTLLKILCGLLNPGSGDVLLMDRSVRQHKPRELARCIALVPQEIQISFDFTVMEFVEQGRTPYVSSFFSGLQQADRLAIVNAMEMADVGPLANRKFSELSGGERQRVKIALALAQEPDLLLLDEPSQHLDIGRQVEVFSVLRRLNQAGITIIAAMHDLHNVYENFSMGLILGPEFSFHYGPPAEIMTGELLQDVFGVNLPAGRHRGIFPASAHAKLVES